MSEFNVPKQEQNISEYPESDSLFSEIEDENEEPGNDILPDKLQTSTTVAKASASILTIALDSTLSSAFALIANDKPETFKADETQQEELQKAFTEYIKLKGGDIPPGIALIILILSIYGSKGVMAVQLRKANKKNELLERENARLRVINQMKENGTSSENDNYTGN
jgi:hypothetical protein